MANITHTQALNKLASDILVQALDEDIARIVAWNVMFKPVVAADILPPLLRRWNCVLQAGDDVATPLYRQTTAVALAILLHKYGIADAALNARAEAGIDALNEAVALSDDFFRKTDAIKDAFLRSPPVPLKRAPSQPDSLTFYRNGDIVSFQLDGRFHAAYVHRCARTNQSPVIEFYETTFTQVPEIAELLGTRAKGRRYNDGVERSSKYSVAGMKFLPDPAAQIVLVKACVDVPPTSGHLAEGVGEYAVLDIFKIQEVIDKAFGAG